MTEDETGPVLVQSDDTDLPAEVMDLILDGANPLAVLMVHRELSQSKLAAMAGLSSQFVSRLSRGRGGASPETTRALAEALDVSPEFLDSLDAKWRLHPTGK